MILTYDAYPYLVQPSRLVGSWLFLPLHACMLRVWSYTVYGVSWKGGTPKSWVFPCKPSFLGYPHDYGKPMCLYYMMNCELHDICMIFFCSILECHSSAKVLEHRSSARRDELCHVPRQHEPSSFVSRTMAESVWWCTRRDGSLRVTLCELET